MFQSDKPPVRRAAVITATVAATTVASVLGFGSAALADAPAATPSTATTSSPSATSTTSTSAPTSTPAPASTSASTSTPTTGTTGSTGTSGTGTQASGDLAFTEPSTKASPLALTATVGTPFAHTFHTTGGNGTVGYAIQDAPNADYTVNVETGVLSGTPTTAGTFDFEVVALSGGQQVTEYVRLTVAPSPLSFTPQSTKAQPLALTATAGTTFTHRFTTTGGTGPLAYALGANPTQGFSVNLETGVLTSTVITAGTYDLEVDALRGTATATEYVRLTVLPAKPVGILTVVGSNKPGTPGWDVAPDGTITEFSATGKPLGHVASVSATQGSTLVVAGLAVDRFGNATDIAHPQTSLTSSIASDRIVADSKGDSSTITFVHASSHRLTIAQDGVSTSFTVSVTPVATTVVATTPTTTGKALAYTGADETTPIAWALGLFASGASLLLFRFRRRRG